MALMLQKMVSLSSPGCGSGVAINVLL